MGDTGTWVGRERELVVLDDALARLADGVGGAISISGEPGIGKSRLLARAGQRAEVRGALLLEGQATELERDFPFAVWVDTLDPYLASLGPGAPRALSEEQRRLLGVVFPALAGAPVGSALKAEERFRCHRAVRELLGVLALSRPVVVALDDLHWADAASLELLDHVLRRPPSGPVLLLLVHRASFPVAPLSRVAEHLELGPLAQHEADRLLDDELSVEVRAALFRESGGNPFYLEQLARHERRQTNGNVHLPRELDLEVPRRVREALAGELAALGEQSRRVLQGAAVAGDPFSPQMAAELALEERDVVDVALDQAISAGLARGTDTPVLFRFRHPIVRRAVYASAGEVWRMSAHARAAALLAQRGATPLARAHHVERSAVPGDEDAVVILAAAGHAAATVAPASAAHWFAAALRLLPEDADATQRLALLGPLAAALGRAGQLHESRATLMELLDLVPTSLIEARGRLIGFAGLIDRLLGRPGNARPLLQQTLADLRDPDSAEAAGLELELAVDRFSLGDWTTMQRHAERGWQIAGRVGEEGLRASAAGLLGLAEYSVGRIPASRERREEASALVDRAGESQHGLRLDALDWLGWLELSLEEYDAAVAHFARGLALSRASGAGHLSSTMSFGLVLGCTWSGQLTAGLDHSDTTLDLGRLSGSDQVLAWACGLRSLAEMRTGALAEALEHGAEARRLSAGIRSNPFSAVTGGWFGEALIEAGRPARGREQILRALGGTELPAVEAAYRPYFYDVLTGAELALGRPPEASAWARAAMQAADGLGLNGRTGAALHAAAMAEGDPEAGAALAQRALECLSVAHPVEAARARALAGRLLGAAGHREAALEQLQQAASELAALGARHLWAQAIRERRRLGERLPRGGRRSGTVTGLASLSEREHQVASLVEGRLTNREIAQRLVISEKTVERHLSRIFVKLEARSRVEVARALQSAAPSG